MQTRLAHAADLDHILRLLGQLVIDEASPPTGVAQATLAEMERNPAMHLFVVDHGEQVVATCVLATLPNLTRGCRPYGLIENVVVDAQHRGQGIGARMMRDVVAAAWHHDCYKVMLLSNNVRSHAQEFYRACGFSSREKQGFVMRRP